MTTDFDNAAERHWSDAELLYADKRKANADQLFGLAAECGLKAVMLALGMTISPKDGKPVHPAHQVHIDRLWIEFGTFLQGVGNTQYSLPSQNPFQNWQIGQRYWHSRSINDGTLNSHRQGAREVRKIVGQARMDGRL